MSGLTGAGFAATQYALLSSLYALPGKVVGGVSGFVVESFGYAAFFAMTAAVGVPVVILCLILGRVSDAAEAESEDETVATAQAAVAR
jgi:PAT family beta-lactamase induction signal transducer AmpG